MAERRRILATILRRPAALARPTSRSFRTELSAGAASERAEIGKMEFHEFSEFVSPHFQMPSSSSFQRESETSGRDPIPKLCRFLSRFLKNLGRDFFSFLNSCIKVGDFL